MNYRLSPEAQEDIDAIWDYIAQDDPSAAERFIARLGEKFFMLTQQPRSGRPCEELAPSLRCFPLNNYVIFDRIASGALEIVRILHGARDIEALFGPEDQA